MRSVLAFAVVCVVFLLMSVGLRMERVSALPAPVPQPPVYRLAAWKIANTSPIGHMWLIEDNDGRMSVPPGEVFQSLAAPDLRHWVSQLPADSRILYNYIGTKTPAETQFQHDQGQVFPEDTDSGMDDFGQFCRRHNVRFDIVRVDT